MGAHDTNDGLSEGRFIKACGPQESAVRGTGNSFGDLFRSMFVQ
jgi:hypothetical protein